MTAHGKTALTHTDECRTRTDEQMQYDPESQKRLQVHSRRRDAESETEGTRTLIVRDDEIHPVILKQQDVEISVESSYESASVIRWADTYFDNEERTRLRLRTEDKRYQTHDIQDIFGFPEQEEDQTGVHWGIRNEKAFNFSRIWRKRLRIQRWQFLLRVSLLRLKESRAPVRMCPSFRQRLWSWVLRTECKSMSLFRRMWKSNFLTLAQLDRFTFMKIRSETSKYWQILYWSRMYVQEIVVGNRCKISCKSDWRLVKWIWQKSTRQLSSTNI